MVAVVSGKGVFNQVTAAGSRIALGLGPNDDVTFGSVTAGSFNGPLTLTAPQGMTASDGAGIFFGRTITGTLNEVEVTNGDGQAGDPIISLPANISVDVTGDLTGSHNGPVGDVTPNTGEFTTVDASGNISTNTQVSAATLAGADTFTDTLTITGLGTGIAVHDGSGVWSTIDHEEGTFTPFFVFANGSTGLTHSTQLGNYVKIGQSVTAEVDCIMSNKGTSTGQLFLRGLPFTKIGGTHGAVTPGFYNGYTGLTGSLAIRQQPGSAEWRFTQFNNSTGVDNVIDTNCTNVTRIIATVSYVST